MADRPNIKNEYFKSDGCECPRLKDNEEDSYRLNSYQLDGEGGEGSKFWYVEELLIIRWSVVQWKEWGWSYRCWSLYY